MQEAPRFEVRAVGAFAQKPGCPEESQRGLSAQRLESLCRGECYHPDDARQADPRDRGGAHPPRSASRGSGSPR